MQLIDSSVPGSATNGLVDGSLDVTGKTTQELEQILRDRYTGAGYLRSPRLGVELRGDPVEITGITHDSTAVRPASVTNGS